MGDLTRLDATRLLEAYDAGTVTSEQYVLALLERIKDRDPVVRAWVHIDPDDVLQQARRADQVPKHERGALHGVPVAIKDVIYTKGMPTQQNSTIYRGDQPELDAASVIMLRNAGAIIMGKTATTEFATSTVGPATTNPHDPKRTPGGSSSGSAAAVADWQAPLALGTQTGGSIIRPASFTGVFGMKPTWNAISREGQKFCSVNLDTLGWFARSVADLALLGRVFGLADDKPAAPFANGVKGLTFGFTKTPVWDDHAGLGTCSATEQGINLLRSAGANVDEITLPDAFARLPEFQRIMMKGDIQTTFRCEHGRRADELDPTIRYNVEQAPSHASYLEAVDAIASLRPEWDAIARQYAAVIVPSVPDEAPEGLGFTGDQIFNAMWTALHVPVINIPAFKGQHGMPVGLSVVQGRYKDEALLSVAEAISHVWLARHTAS